MFRKKQLFGYLNKDLSWAKSTIFDLSNSARVWIAYSQYIGEYIKRIEYNKQIWRHLQPDGRKKLPKFAKKWVATYKDEFLVTVIRPNFKRIY